MEAEFFTKEELRCRHCGEFYFDKDALALLDEIRRKCNFPFPVSSGYRCQDHPVEAGKDRPGEHTEGLAVDLLVRGQRALILVGTALQVGVPRIGVQQKGPWARRYIHLGFSKRRPSTMWSY